MNTVAPVSIATQRTPVDQADPAVWGGKGAGLIRLAGWGFDVPPFFVLPGALYRAIGPAASLSDLPPASREQLLAAVAEGLAGLGAEPVAVRSSALDEDGGAHSLAGQMDSFLNVPATPEAVAEHVLAAWRSLRSDRAVAYRARRGLATDDLAMAVVVQTMLNADRALVAFSANPLTGDPDQMLVSAAWGLGDGLVSGEVDGDTDVLGAGGALVSHAPGEQESMRVVAESGVVSVPVDAAKRGVAVLGEDDRHAVWAMAGAVAARFGRPVDIEAAFVDGRLYCLQARAITTPIGGVKRLWDNANIVESYAGVTTPLTFSHANNAYRIVYTLFGRMLGVPREVHEANERAMQTYLGLMQGRVYYNLLTWYLSMAHLPGYGFTRGAMENMMGVKEALNVELPPAGSPLGTWTKDLPQLVAMLARTIWSFARVRRLVADFEANFEAVYGAYRHESFEGWDTERAVGLYHELVYKVLHRWQAPILTDVGAMVCMRVLQTMGERWAPDAPGLVSELLVGEGDIESTQPARRLLAIATQLRSIPEAQAALALDPADFFKALQREPALAPIHAALDDWLTRYGDRAMNELKLEAPSLRDRPAFVVTMLRNYMAMPPFDAEAVAAAERAGRAKAESRLKQALQGQPFRAWQFNVVLGWTRMHLRNRENMRFARTRLTGVVRRLFTAVGRDLAARGVLAQADDVYYLTVDELTAYVDGRSVTRDLAALAALRRAEFEGYRASEPPERFVTVGLPHQHPIAPTSADESSDGALVGTPCCAGVVEGPTRLIRDPDSDMTLRGEILVAPRTDPGWVALFPASTGLLVERGSVLSHSAIVARELGLPTIVGIPGLCRRLNQGQRVRMDGASGRIEVLEGASHGA